VARDVLNRGALLCKSRREGIRKILGPDQIPWRHTAVGTLPGSGQRIRHAPLLSETPRWAAFTTLSAAGTLALPQNDERAAYWYGQAARRGHTGAQLALGALYALGRGVLRNEAVAVFWFGRACKRASLE
jgi:hypothetical protein